MTRFGFATAGLYIVAVALGTIVLDLWRRFTSPKTSDPKTTSGHRWSSSTVTRDVSVVNAFASLVVIPLLVLVSSSTTVTVTKNGSVTHYPWFPAWLGAIATVVVLLFVIRAVRRAGSDSERRQRVERRALLMVVVPIFLFVVTGSLQSAQGQFFAFDDAQGMVGAKLSFWHGLWPWRDLFLLHGFLADTLYGAVGMWVISATRWGSNSGLTLFIAPFTVVMLYTFIVYFAAKEHLPHRRRNARALAGALARMVRDLFRPDAPRLHFLRPRAPPG